MGVRQTVVEMQGGGGRMTQGDVIRKMTNEQIARLLARTYEDGMLEALQHGNVTCTWEDNNKRWQEWVDYDMVVR